MQPPLCSRTAPYTKFSTMHYRTSKPDLSAWSATPARPASERENPREDRGATSYAWCGDPDPDLVTEAAWATQLLADASRAIRLRPLVAVAANMAVEAASRGARWTLRQPLRPAGGAAVADLEEEAAAAALVSNSSSSGLTVNRSRSWSQLRGAPSGTKSLQLHRSSNWKAEQSRAGSHFT